MRDDWEALSATEQREKARAIAEDIETLQDAPESLKEDVAALVGEDEGVIERFARRFFLSQKRRTTRSLGLRTHRQPAE